ncbi:MAG: glycerol-3-phosphate 1-O-acyltransferase PlsY [Alphaproteobacteria bacterium]|nr:glycerol-3-phosphate 1-O-acyltransferase PlsY [Alphaproteobacteria bacterium]
MLYVFGLIIAYLLGSIPFGVLMTRWFGRGDLRKVGSGNIGAANAMRAGGLRVAGLVWIADMVKSIAAVLIGMAMGGDVLAAWCGFASVLGHCFPIWLGFRGGKGVSCLFGILLAINPLLFIICGIVWLVVAFSFGYSSLAGLTVFFVASVLGFAIGGGIGLAILATCLLCLVRHMENIGRLIGGTESKLVWKWKK